MTEAEWWACSEPIALLTSLRNRASRHRLRLFAVACCRRIWSLLVDEQSQQAVERGGTVCRGRASRAERVAARTAALAAVATSWQGDSGGRPCRLAILAVQGFCSGHGRLGGAMVRRPECV